MRLRPERDTRTRHPVRGGRRPWRTGSEDIMKEGMTRSLARRPIDDAA
jgi:hypothetical protein